MNNLINRRIWFLIQKQWQESLKAYLGGIGILLGILFIIYGVCLMTDRGAHIDQENFKVDKFAFARFSSLSFRAPAFMFSALVYLSFVAGNYFARYNQANTSIQELTLPASAMEKMVVALLGGVLLSAVTFIGSFLLVDGLFVSALQYIYSDIDLMHIKSKYADWNNVGFPYFLQSMSGKELLIFVASGFFLPSVFLLGSIYFRRMSYLKTALATTMIFSFIISFPSAIEGLFYKNMVRITDYTTKGTDVPAIYFIIIIIALLCLWIATYFRLKEKEV